MSNIDKLDDSDVEPICAWCSRSYSDIARAEKAVCPRCLKLLHGAGIPQEEIYGGRGLDGTPDE